MHNRKDETGNQYGKLTVQGYGYLNGKKAMWKCRCSCGLITFVSGGDLRRTDSKAIRMCLPCGKSAGLKHGHTTKAGYQSPTYVSWYSMKLRCKNDSRYEGISICKEWEDFRKFLADMGERPTIVHTLDRIDGNIGYTKENCRWATKTEQSRNLKSNVWITIENRTQVLFDWLKELGLPVSTYYDRVRVQGLSPTEALVAPRK